MADSELWQRAKQGDEAAIARLLQAALSSHEITMTLIAEPCTKVGLVA